MLHNASVSIVLQSEYRIKGYFAVRNYIHYNFITIIQCYIHQDMGVAKKGLQVGQWADKRFILS